MKYATAAAFRQALDDRLKTEAVKTGLGIARLRKRVAFELFLRRLVAVAPNRWVLKGALALDFRFHATSRPTRDMDLGRADDEDAAIERVRVPALPLPQHIAEKVHAYTRKYGQSGRESTRPKDLVDILLIIGTEQLDAAQLREALETTFHERAQQPLPSSLPPPPENWREPYPRLATEVDVEPELDNAYTEAAACLDPIFAGRTTGVWDPQRRTWR